MKFSLVDVACAIGITVMWITFTVYFIAQAIDGKVAL